MSEKSARAVSCRHLGVAAALFISVSATARAQAPVSVGETRPYSAESPHPYLVRARGAAVAETAGVVWRDEVASPGARFVRVHFSRFEMAPGDFVTVSDARRTMTWQYTGRGPTRTGSFWAFAVPGDTALVELHAKNGNGYGYRMTQVGHGTVDIYAGEPPPPGEITTESICNGDGKEAVVCHPEANALQRPVARLVFATGSGGMALCTGSLVAGSNPNTLMTNNHCISNQAGVSSLQAIFNFQRTTCGGTTNAATTTFRGDRFLKTSPVNGGLDYTLLTLQGNAEATFGELTAGTNAAVDTPIWIIQHPGGKPKEIAVFADPAHQTRCRVTGVSGTQTSYNCDTEGGSSGSPVLNPATGRIVGLHHFGGCPNNSATRIGPICTDAGALLQCGGTGPTPTPTPTPPGSPNLALNKPATGSTPCNANEGPDKAVNGSVSGGNSDKWCSLAATKFLQVDLGAGVNVGRIVVRHAGAGGESATFNTRAFNIQVSSNGATFTTVATAGANTQNVSTHTIAATTARFVRLNVTTPTQTADGAARIYELEVFGQ
jgi:lysyl endopeptidase